MVTVTVEDTDRYWTTTPAQYERGVLTANQVSEVWPSFSGDRPAFENAWAQQQLKTFMRYQGAKSLEGFSKGSPERNITAVTNPEPGVVRFEVRDLDYEVNGWDLDFMAMNFMSYTGCAASDVDAVIVKRSAALSRRMWTTVIEVDNSASMRHGLCGADWVVVIISVHLRCG